MTKPSIYPVTDSNAFKQSNLENWHENSAFWLDGKMRHLKDVSEFTAMELERLLDANRQANNIPSLYDFGCGDGWILRLLEERHFAVRYCGIDYNERFIEELKKRHGNDDKHRFYCFDLEKPPPAHLRGQADVGLNFFNLFELADVSAGFKNIATMLRVGGRLLVVNIDPTMQILAVSNDFASFVKNLAMYERYKERLGYDKDIDIGDEPSGRIYKSLLYSTATYVRLANESGLAIEDYKEIIKTGNKVPQIYQFLFFIKK